ncbi:MAG: response regulator transcription factor [Bdellovibrionales bacterium]|jgi:DNA-binding response OmpR family regulator|nr:response regulator transcription factor [Bdellovibrionales bacterium]
MEKILVFYEIPKDLLKLEVAVDSLCEVIGETNQQEFVKKAIENEFTFLVVCCRESEINGPILVKKICENQNIETPIIVYESKISKSIKLKFLQYGVLDIVSLDDDSDNIFLRFQINLKKKKYFNNVENASIIKKGNFKIDFQTNNVQVREEGSDEFKKIELTQIEFKLLSYFIRNEKKIFTREQIVDFLGGGDIVVSERAIDVHISSLRKKSKVIRNAIQTIYGLGYKFVQAS